MPNGEEYLDYDNFEEEELQDPSLEDDSYTVDAKQKIKDLFIKDPRAVFYTRQLQIMFEKDIFHWITTRAVIELEKERILKSVRLSIVKGSKAKFVFLKEHRYHKRQINKILPLIKQYSNSVMTKGFGRHAEIIFQNALAREGFMPYGDSNIREYKGRKWRRTDNNLDFIVERDGIGYGCEVKNKLDYIELEELEIKLDMCDYLRIKPLFIMRYAPKTYMYEIYQRGGYGRLFVKQIYPLGHEPFVEKIEKELGLPVECRAEVSKGFLNKFVDFHNKYVNLKKNSQNKKRN